jgi:hypothetical protein
MKNLHQKLSKENRSKLVQISKLYPATCQLLMNALKTNHSWSQISLGDALQLWNTFEAVKPFDFEEFTNLFKNN